LSYGTGVLQGLDVVPGVALAAKGGKALGEALASKTKAKNKMKAGGAE